jgi:hypothetical protein
MQKIEAIFHDTEREIPVLGRVVAQGETFEVSDEIAENLLLQEENFRAADAKPAPVNPPAKPDNPPAPKPADPAPKPEGGDEE